MKKEKIICEMCSGKGEIENKYTGVYFKCPECEGFGFKMVEKSPKNKNTQ